MGQDSKIEWTDHTFNAWRGCTKVSAGCAHCYAEKMSGRNPKSLGIWGDDGTRVVAAESYWKLPIKWNREAEAAGERRSVFCLSFGDVFEAWAGAMTATNGERLYVVSGEGWVRNPLLKIGHDRRPLTMTDVRLRLFNLVRSTPWLDWLLLTKRPENVVPAITQAALQCNPGDLCEWLNNWIHGSAPDNVRLGVTIENQKAADERREVFKACPAAIKFVSNEPAIGAINWTGWEFVHQIISGGESGPKARPSHPDWHRATRDFCTANGIAFFFKQWGEHIPMDHATPAQILDNDDVSDFVAQGQGGPRTMPMYRVGKKAAGRVLDGRTWDEFPKAMVMTDLTHPLTICGGPI